MKTLGSMMRTGLLNGLTASVAALLLTGAAPSAFAASAAPAQPPASAAPPPAAPSADAASANAADPVAAAMREFTQAIDDSRKIVEQHPYYADPAERAAGALYFSSMLLRRIETELLQDPDFPWFSSIDYRVREGGDNPDQHYLATPIRGGATYRIWGRKGGETTAERYGHEFYEEIGKKGGQKVRELIQEAKKAHKGK